MFLIWFLQNGMATSKILFKGNDPLNTSTFSQHIRLPLVTHHFSIVWLSCHSPMLPMLWYFPWDDRHSTKPHLCVPVTSEPLLLSGGSRCKPSCLLIRIQSIFLQWQRNWQRCSTSHSYVLCMSLGTFLCCSPITLMCCLVLLPGCTFHWERILQRTRVDCHHLSKFSDIVLKQCPRFDTVHHNYWRLLRNHLC